LEGEINEVITEEMPQRIFIKEEILLQPLSSFSDIVMLEIAQR